MSNFEFHYKNILNTTTMVTPSIGGTSTVAKLFDRKTSSPWGSGDNSDATTSSIKILFSQATPITNICIQNTNFKSFSVYYNSSSANKLALIGANTTTSEWVSNSETSFYLQFSTIAVTSVFIVGTTTIVSAAEKKIGQLWLLNKIHSFSYNPSASDFKPNYDRQEYVHSMSDGGTVTYVIQDNYVAKIKRSFVTETEYEVFKDIYEMFEPVVFVAFPTGTSFNNEIYEVNWIGSRSNQFSNNYTANGKDISFDLRETPK